MLVVGEFEVLCTACKEHVACAFDPLTMTLSVEPCVCEATKAIESAIADLETERAENTRTEPD